MKDLCQKCKVNSRPPYFTTDLRHVQRIDLICVASGCRRR